MALDDIAHIVINAETRTPSVKGFGTPLILCNQVPAGMTDRVVGYSSLKEMTEAGWTSAHPGKRAAAICFSQNPAPKTVKMGRRVDKLTQSFELKCLSAIEGDVYKVTINGTALTYTVLAAATTTTVATALELLVDAVTDVSSTSATDTVTCTVAAGKVINVEAMSSNLEFLDTTVDGGIADELDACLEFDDDFFGVALDHPGTAESVEAAEWCEANEKVSFLDTFDTTAADSGTTTDLGSQLQTLNLGRVGCFYNSKELLSYTGLGLLANRLPHPPGSYTMAFKTLPGVKADKLTSSQISALKAKNYNYYTVVGGVAITQYGYTASGEWMDVAIGLAWLKADMQRNIYQAKLNRPKIPFTNKGKNIIVSAIDTSLKAAVAVDLFSSDPAPTVTAPDVATVSSANKIARNLPDVGFSATLAGAIHLTNVTGTVSA
jgi:hypothetical protein